MGVDVPDHLLDWDAFQKEFLLKWADLNAQDKAQAKFAAGLKQTTLVCRYAKLFKETVLEADFTDPVILMAAFYEGLKWEIKQLLIRRQPEVLADLKLLAISLDEERMGAERCESKPNPNRNATEPTWQSTTQVKAEVARVGTTLSADDCVRYMREGQCFGCGKTGHRRPECPNGKTQAHVAAIEPAVSEPTLNPIEPKN